MKYFFNCLRKCGQYEVSLLMFNQFINQHLKEKLKKSIGAVWAELEFKQFCPRCKPNQTGPIPVTLQIFRPKKL